MNFSRKTILVVGAALLAAACGDKVTVQEYQPPTQTPKVNFVEVTPATATVNTGASITFTAAVNADVGLATTVTWSASAGTVTSAGVFTAPSTANPGVSVCATSTADAGKKGCASVVVSAPPATFPATVSIASITTGALNVPVNPAAVVGQIDVTLNINPGTQTISKVELLLDGTVAYTQNFTAAQSAALRFAADEAIAAQTTFPQVIASINTACYQGGGSATCDGYKPSDAAGAPIWLNGARALQAKIYTTTSGSSQAASASVSQNLVLANVDGFHVTTSGGTSAVDATGYRWTGNGSLTVSAIPVLYSGSSLGTVASALGANTIACAAVGAIGTATTATDGAYVIVGTLAGLQSPAGCTTTTPNLVTITATSAAGDNLTLAGTGVLNVQPGLRWDNVAPTAPAFTAALPNARTGGWINDAVVFNLFNAGTAATVNNWIGTASTDAGVGLAVAGAGITYTATTGANGANLNAARFGTGTALTSAATLAPSATGATYCAVATATDALGNRSTQPAAGSVCGATTQSVAFGVDRYAPTAAFSSVGTLAANGGFTVLTATSFKVVASDTGLAGNSGFLAGVGVTHVVGSISRRTAAATSGTAVTVSAAAAGATNFGLTRYDGLAAAVADTVYYDGSLIATNAYYTLTTSVVDQAGNSSGTLTRTVLKDNTIPTALAPVQNVVSPTAGGALTFNSNIADDLDISNGSLSLTFPAASFSGVLNVAAAVAAAPAVYAINAVGPITFNTYNVAPAVTSGTLSATLPALYALQGHADSTTIVASNSYPTAINAVVSDMANPSVTSAAGTVQNPPAAPALYAIGTEYQKFLLARSGTTVNVAGSGTAGAVFSRNITPRVEGTTTQVAPFNTIDLYVLGTGQTAYNFLGTSSLVGQTDNGGQRVWTFSAVAFAPSATFPVDAATVMGIARNSGGKYVMGQGVQVTVAP